MFYSHKHTLLHITSSLKMGGAETVLYELVKGLGAREFEHHVIYFHGGPWVEPLRELGVSLYHVRGAVCLYDPVFFWRLYRAIKKINPACIHSLLWAANIASRIVARLLSIPHISVYHNNIDQDGRVRNLLDARTRRMSNHLVAVSGEVAQSICAQDKRFSAADITVIRNGIDADELVCRGREAAVARESLGLRAEDFVIGSVGRFCPVKNYPLLLNSFARLHARLPFTKLVLLGSGPDEQALRDQARTLGVEGSVIFVVGKQAHGYFHLFDCFVQSSDKEGISMALLEAMAHARPCVVTNEGKRHSVLTNYVNGIIVPAGDEQDLCAAIRSLVLYPEPASVLGALGRRTVQTAFCAQTMIQAYRDLFISCCNLRSCR